MSHSATVGHLPHSALELCCAETRTSAPLLKAYLLTAPVKQFPENHSTEQSAYWVADGTHNSSPNADTEAQCPEVTVVNAERSGEKHLSLSVHRMLCTKRSTVEDNHLQKYVCSMSSAMDAIDHHEDFKEPQLEQPHFL
jgi:hypothetical protein